MSALEKVIELSHTLLENTDKMQEKFIWKQRPGCAGRKTGRILFCAGKQERPKV